MRLLPKQLLPSPTEQPDLLVFAGEHSGDAHAALQVRQYLEIHPEAKVYALGGPKLQAAGATLLFDLTEHTAIGFVEVFKNLPFFLAMLKASHEWIERYRPKKVLFADYPGFNLNLAKRLYKSKLSRKAGGPVELYYYISPQIWAWKAKRRFKMARILDKLGTILPFEPDYYKDTDLNVEFVGHPFMDPSYSSPMRFDPNGPLLLYPGSRKTPIGYIFPTMLATFELLLKDNPHLRAIVQYPSQQIKMELEQHLAQFPKICQSIDLVPVEEKVSGCATLASSGTISLQCALAGLPGVLMYKLNPITYKLGRRLIKINTFGLASIILGETFYAEYIQDAAEPKHLAQALKICISDKASARWQQQSKALHEALQANSTNNLGQHWID